MAERYRIADEPKPGGLSQLAVQPFWPLLGLMLGGFWVAMPWFALNGLAVGCPRRGREIGVAIVGLLGAFGIVAGLLYLDRIDVIETSLQAKLGLLVLVLWKLSIGYWLYELQARSFELYEHYGGIVRNGALVVAAAFFLKPKLFGLVELPLLVSLALR